MVVFETAVVVVLIVGVMSDVFVVVGAGHHITGTKCHIRPYQSKST